MRKMLAAAALLSAASITTIAFAQIKPLNPDGSYSGMVTAQPAAPTAVDAGVPVEMSAPDARTLASDREVGDARRAYRAQCVSYQAPGYCDCVTAGVAQALMPAEVRIAARTLGQRINAQGDASIASESDTTVGAESSAARIEQIEGHYADACAQFRR